MRSRIFAAGIVLSVMAVLAVSFGSRASTLSIKERYAAEKASDTGTSGVYTFDKNHTFISFKARHMGLIDVPGFFRDISGTINYDAKDVTRSTVEFTAKTASIDTGVAARDNHLRSADFFEVEKYPEITFKSTGVAKQGDQWSVTGTFTMKGVTKTISFPFNIAGFLPADQRNGGRMGVTAATTLNRREYGINWGGNLPNGAAAVSDQIKIDLQIEAVKPKEEPKPAP
jgi:polyisoprenoid-binding protein YceI